LVRIQNTDRYDDRAYIQTNLIEAYDQLMDFVAKHLSDQFYLEGTQRVSLRSKIFREIAANLIVHREYTNAHPCTFVIYRDRVQTENANNPHGDGPINPLNFAPFAKNPALVKFFIQLGRAEELGSGVLNVNRYIKAYSGKEAPQFLEGNVFKMIIPLPGGVDEGLKSDDGTINGVINNRLIDTVSDTRKKRLAAILNVIHLDEKLKVSDLSKKLHVSDRTIKEDLKLLIDAGLVVYVGSKKTGSYELHDKLHDNLHDKTQ